MTWVQMVPTTTAAFLASLVEFVEALTVVLAVGSVRGWRTALVGTGAGLAILLAIIAELGPALHDIPLAPLQVAVGVLLLLFGLRWLRKAVLRAAGIIPLHDEAALYAKETSRLRGLTGGSGWDWISFSTCFEITLLEGTEVVFIVIAIGAGGSDLLDAASLGALAALVAVMLVGIALNRPLANVPKNTLKLLVGAMLSAFGTFWFAEGVSAEWPGGDWALLGLLLTYVVLALLLAAVCRRQRVAWGAA
jgi:uncharacterized membrane protein